MNLMRLNPEKLFVMGIVSVGLAIGAQAAITIGAGETLRSTDAALDAWREVVGEGDGAIVRYTPDIVLNGGMFVLDDAVPSEFAGTVSGVGALELCNAAAVGFSGGEGLQEGATVSIRVSSETGKVTLGSGNVFGGASSLHIDQSLVWGPTDGDIVFPGTMQMIIGGSALYACSGRTWTINGPVRLTKSSSLANFGTFVLGGELTFGEEEQFLALYEGTSHDFSDMTVVGSGKLIFNMYDASSVVKLPTSESAVNLTIEIPDWGTGSIDLGGADCVLGEIMGLSKMSRILNSGAGEATLTLARPNTFKGVVGDWVNLVVPGGTNLRASGLNTGSVKAQDGMVTLLGDATESCVRARYVRFVVDKIRTTGDTPRSVQAWDIVAFAEIVLTTDGGATHLPWPTGTTATQEFRFSDTTCGAEKVIDGDTSSKTCVEMQEAGFSVKIDMGRPVAFSGYKWWTADDSPERDPMAWHLEVSNDGVNWTVVDTVTEADFTTPTTRTVQAYYTDLDGEDVADVPETASPVLVGDEASMFSCGAYRWLDLDVTQVSNLVLNGTVLNWNAALENWHGLLAGWGSVDLGSATSERVEVPFDCEMPGVSFVNSGSTAKVLSFGENTTRLSVLGARHVRFNVTKIRGGASIVAWTVVALSEFRLMQGGQELSWPTGTTATQMVDFNSPTICGADRLIDGLTSTKHCIEMFGDHFCVQFDLPQKAFFDGYCWYTADDAPQRDPNTWTLEISDDGRNWTVVDSVTDFDPTTGRYALATTRSLNDESRQVQEVDAIADKLVIEVNGNFAVEGAGETVAGLVGTGMVSLVTGGELTLNVPANTPETMPLFSGKVMCDGALVKTGAGTQRLSGRIDCDRLVVREGVLDVRGAVFTRKVKVELEGGRLYGRSGITIMIR